jgi:hypothetical protein
VALVLLSRLKHAINFEPVESPAVTDRIDGACLPLVIREAGIPLDPSLGEQKNIMLRCKGAPARMAPKPAA